INQSVTEPKRRSAKAFRNTRERTTYWVILISLLLLGGLFAAGLLLYNNPVPVDSPSFIPVTKRRMVAVTAMLIAAVCQRVSTVELHTITRTSFITPSLLGYDSLYSPIHASVMFVFGAGALVNFAGTGPVLAQVPLMILVSLTL